MVRRKVYILLESIWQIGFVFCLDFYICVERVTHHTNQVFFRFFMECWLGVGVKFLILYPTRWIILVWYLILVGSKYIGRGGPVCRYVCSTILRYFLVCFSHLCSPSGMGFHGTKDTFHFCCVNHGWKGTSSTIIVAKVPLQYYILTMCVYLMLQPAKFLNE